MEKQAIICEESTAKALKYYEDNYDVIPLPCPDKIEYIKTSNEYVCRFCGKDKSQTTFKKKAHAIPEFLGNKTLRTKNECDACNSFFGNSLEDNLAKFLLPYNSLAQIYGKVGVPKYVDKDKNVRIESNNNTAHIISTEKPAMVLDEENKSISMQMQTQKFKPVKVYKAFLKMALSIMPEEELINFKELIEYVKEKQDRVFKGLSKVIMTFTPGPKPYHRYMNIILKRKNDEIILPYMYYVFAYGNFMFQVIVPSLLKDKNLRKNGQNFTVSPFPSCYDFVVGDNYDNANNIIKSKVTIVDLSKKEPVKMPLSFLMHYKEIIKDIDDTDNLKE